MPVPSKPEPHAPNRASVTRVSLGSLRAPPLANCLVLIKHPEQGDELNGKELCDQIRQLLKNQPGHVCFFHDGTGMVNARIGYANAFKELDRELAERTTESVCAIPGAIPRMMLYTVATIAEKPWSIFRTRPEAEMHMRMRGYAAADYTQPFEGVLKLRWPGRS